MSAFARICAALSALWPSPAPTFSNRMRFTGRVTVELRGADGEVKAYQQFHNLVTDIGDAYCAKKVTATSVTAMAGMKLGTATTTASKSGAGSFVATGDYVSGSAHALDATFPKLGASNNIAQFKVTWAAGEATASNINRVSIVNNTTNAGEADATGTMAAAVFSAAINKGASDTLTVTWDITFLGA